MTTTTAILFLIGYLLVVISIIAIKFLALNCKNQALISLFLIFLCIGVYLITPIELASELIKY